jgi:hypothetical protein
MMQRRSVQKILAWLFVACVVCGSLFRQTSLGMRLQTKGAMHLGLHAVVYCVLMLMLGSTTRSFSRRCAVFVLLVGLAWSTEFYEHLRDTYPIEQPDVIADCSGAAIGLVFLSSFSLIARREEP